MSNSLYKLTDEFNAQLAYLEAWFNENDVDQQVISDTMDSLQAPIEEKVENIVKHMKSLEALAEAKKAEAKRLNESAASDLKKAEYFKHYMADNLKKANVTKLQAGVFSLGWRKGSEVVKVDESKLPSWAWKKPDPVPMSKTELKKIIKDENIEIPGVQIVRNPDSLSIK